MAKRLKIEDDDDDDDDVNASSDHMQTTGGQRTLGGQTEHDDINRIRTGPVESSESGCSVGALDPSAEGQAPTGTHPLRRRDQLKREVKERTETLRRLKMVKMYRSKVTANPRQRSPSAFQNNVRFGWCRYSSSLTQRM